MHACRIQQFPGDEGREARLQCPKCVFGTNSSRAFMQHAKLHVGGSLPSRQAKEPFRGGSPVLDVSTLVYPSYGDSSGLDTCVHCGFTAPSKSLLREHMRLVHAHVHWEEDGEDCEDLTSQPGTSQDTYTHLPDTATVDYFSKSEPLLASVWQENPSGYDPGPAFGPDYQQPGMRDFPFSYVRVLYVSMCESTCVGMCTCVCKFMQRPKVGVDNHPPLLVLELAAIDQLMGVRQPAPCCGALQGLKTHS